MTLRRCFTALLAGGLLTPPGVIRAQEMVPHGFRITYVLPTKPANAEWVTFFQTDQYFSSLASWLNELFVIREDVPIVFQECGERNAFYSPETHSITMCYELLNFINYSYRKLNDETRRDASLGAIEFVMNHEVGHALVDLLDLPAVGSGEDDADQLSTYLLLVQHTDRAVGAAWSGAVVLDFLGEGKALNDARLSDEHTVDRARYFNIACWIYGSAPTKYLKEAKASGLSASRMRRCPSEYAHINRAWQRLLQSYRPPTMKLAESLSDRRDTLPQLNNKAVISVMKSDLRNLATYEEQYAADNNGAYFSGNGSAQGFTPSANVTIRATATRGWWTATATHLQSAKKCDLSVTAPGVITCN